jgi:hypothetical protein
MNIQNINQNDLGKQMLFYFSKKLMEIFIVHFGISEEFSKRFQYVHTVFF